MSLSLVQTGGIRNDNISGIGPDHTALVYGYNDSSGSGFGRWMQYGTDVPANSDYFGININQAADLPSFQVNRGGGNSIQATPSIAEDAWHQFIFRFSGSTGDAWQDGTKVVDAVDFGYTINGTIDSVRIGMNQSNAQNLYGKIAHAAIWDAVLSTDEIDALIEGFHPQLIRPTALAYWADFDNGYQCRINGSNDLEINTSISEDNPSGIIRAA